MKRLKLLAPTAELRAIQTGLNITQSKTPEAMGVRLRTYEDPVTGLKQKQLQL